MHSDIHALSHGYRATQLQTEADVWRLAHGRAQATRHGHRRTPRSLVRDRFGWALVGIGLRIVSRPLSSSGPLYRPRGPGGTTPRPSIP
ncbi:hypothetical protein FHS42_002290 [Streptomyces zagrosensis]|uniref:Uncharacterized protein n=1 Tax=Streptomyces zagrosensis TaxID=1042984 RepID=A0A7W9Q7W4_9ACTN|nr:hypothetical protein [Streptomyces zagrosensis]